MGKKGFALVLALALIMLGTGYSLAKLFNQDETIALAATYKEVLTTASGAQTEHRYSIAQRPDGFVRVNFSQKQDGSVCRARIISSTVSTTFVVDELQAKSTIYHPVAASSSAAPVQRTVPSRFVRSRIENYFGYEANILTAEDKASKIERWVIPSLGDLMAKDIRYWKDASGGFVSSTEQSLVTLDVGSPDPALFAIPPEYKEMLPSELQTALFSDVLQLPNAKWSPEMFVRPDEIYSMSQIYKR